MAEQRLFHAPNINVSNLGQALADWFRSQGFEIQVLDAPGGGMVLQARQDQAWRNVLGMSATVNVLLRHQQDGNLLVELGAGKWLDKAAAAGVGMFILWPMLLTAGYGAWQQGQLPQRTFEFIQNFLATGGSISADMAVMHASQLDQARRVVGNSGYVGNAPGMVSPPPVAPVTPVAMAETAPLDPLETPASGVRFCTECGTRIPDGARFCPGCGSKAA